MPGPLSPGLMVPVDGGEAGRADAAQRRPGQNTSVAVVVGVGPECVPSTSNVPVLITVPK